MRVGQTPDTLAIPAPQYQQIFHQFVKSGITIYLTHRDSDTRIEHIQAKENDQMLVFEDFDISQSLGPEFRAFPGGFPHPSFTRVGTGQKWTTICASKRFPPKMASTSHIFTSPSAMLGALQSTLVQCFEGSFS